jgi:hypothetical protein
MEEEIAQAAAAGRARHCRTDASMPLPITTTRARLFKAQTLRYDHLEILDGIGVWLRNETCNSCYLADLGGPAALRRSVGGAGGRGL